MTQVPVLSSIVDPEYLAQFVADLYNLEGNISCNVLKTGINHNYLLQVSPIEKFVLRVYSKNWKTEIEIEEELNLLLELKEKGILVSYPILDTSQNYIQKINAPEGERFAVLFTYAEGEFIRQPSKETCYQLGVTMAKLHQITVNKNIRRKTYNAQTLVQWAYEQAQTRFATSPDEMKYYQRATDKITSEFEQANAQNLRKGVVHIDLWYENMKIKNDTEFTLFDFDNCGNGWLFLDISYSLMSIYRNEVQKDNFIPKRTSFYQGYESIIPISDEEKRLVPYGALAIWLHYNGVHVQRFDDFANHFLSEEFLKYWIFAIKQWMEFNEIQI